MRLRILHPREVSQLLAAIRPGAPFAERDRALLTFALHTGLRVSELAGLDVSHVAHRGQPRKSLELPNHLAKGGRGRVIPLNPAARSAVAGVLDFNARRGLPTSPTSPLWLNRRHRRLTVRAIQRLVQSLREQAGLDVAASPHTLRHTFASRLVGRTGNVRVAQVVLGHRRLNTTQIYTHPSRDELAAGLDKLAP